jgi:hypothetical protein
MSGFCEEAIFHRHDRSIVDGKSVDQSWIRKIATTSQQSMLERWSSPKNIGDSAMTESLFHPKRTTQGGE